MVNNAATSWVLNPWQPMSEPIDVAHLGKLAEEVNELGCAVSRCLIQGIDASEPITGKPNREWLEDEIADVYATITMAIDRFGLDELRILARMGNKRTHLRGWHSMLAAKKEAAE